MLAWNLCGNYPETETLANKPENKELGMSESGIWKLFQYYRGDILSSCVGEVQWIAPSIVYNCYTHYSKSRICNGRTLGSVRHLQNPVGTS